MNDYTRQLDVEAIKGMIDPYSFYMAEQSLISLARRPGDWATAGLCPFHEDKKSGSFKVNLETGSFKCWSCGAKGGDIITFLQKRDGLSFREALRKLIETWGTV